MHNIQSAKPFHCLHSCITDGSGVLGHVGGESVTGCQLVMKAATDLLSVEASRLSNPYALVTIGSQVIWKSKLVDSDRWSAIASIRAVTVVGELVPHVGLAMA